MPRGVNSKPAKQAYFGVSERGLSLRQNEEDVLLSSVILYRNIFSESLLCGKKSFKHEIRAIIYGMVDTAKVTYDLT